MTRKRRLFVLAGLTVVAATMVGAFVVRPQSASTQSAPVNVLEIISGSQLEATHAIVLVPAGPGDKAAVNEDQLGARLEAAGYGSSLRESPKLVRLKGGPVSGAKGSGGLMWALVVDQEAGLSGTMGHPYKPSPGATGTYLVVFLTADTGDFVMALGGEKFGK